MDDSPSTRLQVIVDAALEGYERQTGMKLIDHPLARQLEKCDSIQSITALLEGQAQAFSQFRGDDGKVMKPLKCAVQVLHGLSTSTALSEGISLVRCMDFLGIYDPDTRSIAISPCEGNICIPCYPTFCMSFLIRTESYVRIPLNSRNIRQ
jgi:hypothetical protein